MPSILEGIEKSKKIEWDDVLNLVINGMPSILHVGYQVFKLAMQAF